MPKYAKCKATRKCKKGTKANNLDMLIFAEALCLRVAPYVLPRGLEGLGPLGPHEAPVLYVSA
jgi:hypothetical protein